MKRARVRTFPFIIILSLSASLSAFSQQPTSTGETQPALVEKPPLTFPPEALGAGVAGKIWIKGYLELDGVPIKTEIVKREPEMAYMFR